MNPRERPGCLTAYAALLFLAAGLYALSGVALLLDVPEDSGLLPYVIPLLSVILVVTALGIWWLKMWAWWLAVVGHGLLAGLALVAVFSGGDPLSTAIALVISGLVLYWMLANRHLFLHDDRPVAPGGGVWWYVAIALLLPFAVVVGLAVAALLGSEVAGAVGNLFRLR